ncbi:hypothetical protein VNO78_24142 [Psophocarpus tetragonolobus]|uniref:Uncharacterized protein n=1 Tax=Psophocarpus tetragonolobus TaxID=3891 RepID=A0AAN9S4V2_PSOTE
MNSVGLFLGRRFSLFSATWELLKLMDRRVCKSSSTNPNGKYITISKRSNGNDTLAWNLKYDGEFFIRTMYKLINGLDPVVEKGEIVFHTFRDCMVTKEVWKVVVDGELKNDFFSMDVKIWILVNIGENVDINVSNWSFMIGITLGFGNSVVEFDSLAAISLVK